MHSAGMPTQRYHHVERAHQLSSRKREAQTRHGELSCSPQRRRSKLSLCWDWGGHQSELNRLDGGLSAVRDTRNKPPAVKRSLDSLGQVLELRDSAAVNDKSRARGRFRWSC